MTAAVAAQAWLVDSDACEMMLQGSTTRTVANTSSRQPDDFTEYVPKDCLIAAAPAMGRGNNELSTPQSIA